VKVLYAIAETHPFDSLLVRNMRNAVNSLLQLNLKRFRVPEKSVTRYSALDVMKQALELLYEFSPSERNYREAMRTIQVYSEGDYEMLKVLRESFSLIANAIYTAFSGQKHAESLAPEIMFLQGTTFQPSELQESFRFVGVRPPDMSPASAKETIFLDENFEPYKLMLGGQVRLEDAQKGREEHWTRIIESTLSRTNGTALIRAGAEHVDPPASILARGLRRLQQPDTGKLPTLLREKGINLKVIHRIADINKVFGGRQHNHSLGSFKEMV